MDIDHTGISRRFEMKTYTFESNGYKFIMDSGRLNKILMTAYSRLPFETGGVLVGYYTEDLTTAILLDSFEAFKPGEGSVGSFRPDTDFIQAELDRIWDESGGCQYYLGDWHSHPRNLPLPSDLDDETMFIYSDDADMNCPQPILMIVGDRMLSIGDVRIFIYNQGDKIELKKFINYKNDNSLVVA
jgi:integrative and conjugative element protein (TIGR02256 family)